MPEEKQSFDASVSTPDEHTSTEKYGRLTPEEIAKVKSAQKRNIVLAVVGGLILATMGYFAGQSVGSDKEPDSAPIAVVSHEVIS